MPVHIKTPAQIALMRDAGRITAMALQAMREAIAPGVSTAELDRIAADVIAENGAEPTFLHYTPGPMPPYPAVITACINEELVHGIPRKDRILREGDIVSLDCGATYKGFVGDAAFSAGVGKVNALAEKLMAVTEEALYRAIDAARVGHHLSDISYAVQSFVEDNGFNVVREYGGHGVGHQMHEAPHAILNWGPPGRGPILRPGMTIALEPMVIVGDPEVRTLEDQWTVVTCDGSLCAHFEHTIAITEDGPEILTKLD
jgi:methionyl aminopeptidase